MNPVERATQPYKGCCSPSENREIIKYCSNSILVIDLHEYRRTADENVRRH